MPDISLEELGKSIIIHSVLPGEDDYVLPIASDDTANLDSKNEINDELDTTDTLKQDDPHINNAVLTDKTNDELLDCAVKPQKSIKSPVQSKQNSLDTLENIEAPIIKESIAQESMEPSKSSAQLESETVEENLGEKDKEIEEQSALAVERDDDKTKSSSSSKTIESPQNLESIADPIKINTDIEATESISLNHDKLKDKSESLDSKIVALEKQTEENPNTNKVEEKEEGDIEKLIHSDSLITYTSQDPQNKENESYLKDLSVEPVTQVNNDVIKDGKTSQDSRPSSIELQNVSDTDENKVSVQKRNFSKIEKALSSSELDPNISNAIIKSIDTSSEPILAKDSDTDPTTKKIESVSEEENQKLDIISEDSKNKIELQIESEGNKINTDLVNGSDATNLQNENQDPTLIQSDSQEQQDKIEQQKSNFLDEENNTLKPESVVEKSVIKKRYINEKTGEYTNSPEEIFKPKSVKNEVNESDETQAITALFKAEEDKLSSSNNDNKDSNNDSNHNDNSTETNEKQTQNTEDLPKTVDDANKNIHNQLKEHNTVISEMTGNIQYS